MSWPLNLDTIKFTYKAHVDISLFYEAQSYLDQVVYIVRQEGMVPSNFTEYLEKEHSSKL